MVKLFSLKSPDEWATTKQACRDTYVVTCFLPSTIRILALLYEFSTVLRISSSNLLYIYVDIFIIAFYLPYYNCNIRYVVLSFEEIKTHYYYY